LAQQVVTMADLLKSLNLTKDQIAKVATALNTTPEQLSKMQVVGGNGQTNNAGSIDAAKLISKVAQVLNLTKAQTDTMFSALNVSSVDVKNLAAPAVGGNDVASPLQVTPANPAMVAQVAISEAKQAMQQDAGGNNNFGSGTQFGSTGNSSTQQTNSGTNANGFNAALNAAAAGNPNSASQVGSSAAVSAVATAQEHANSALMGQIVEKASFLSLPNATETKISLSPEKLGTVDIKLTMTDSNVSASIVVGSDAVKQVVEKNLDQLKLALNQQGIMVSQMNVSVGQQGNQSFGHDGMFGQNFPGGPASNADSAAPVDLSTLNHAGAASRYTNALVDLTA
jgi:flagellar hook-length control protein FliK